MSTKNSQKTEDMLDQTFANFDTQVTGMDAQTGDGATQGGKTAPGGAKKKSSNTVIFIAAGVAAIAVVGYLFVLKPMIAEPAYTPPMVAQQNNEAKPEAPKAPESAQPVAADQAQIPALPDANTANVPQIPALPDANTAVPQIPALPDANTAVPQIPALPDANAAVPQIPALPDANAAVPQIPEIPDLTNIEPAKTVSFANTTSVAEVEELKSLFDAQTTEFRNILGDVDMKITGIESNIQKQNEFNTKVEERLTALESGKKSVATPTKKQDGAEKPVVVKKIVKQPKKEKAVKNTDSEVLIDKSSASSTKKEAKSSLPEVNVYSVYGGRVWIKNADGSLSTYASGDEIAPGEKIKSINDETFEILTNKRRIKK